MGLDFSRSLDGWHKLAGRFRANIGSMTRLRMALTLIFVLPIACGGITQPTSGSPSDASSESSSDALPPGCPASMPDYDQSCSLPEGTECKYDASHDPCGTAKCVGGKWQLPIKGITGCVPPPGTEPCKKTFDKTCKVDGDCTIGLRETSCCGDTYAMGIVKSEASAFAANEAICRRTYPGCGCASRGIETDEGRPETGFLTPEQVKVTCVASQCHTSPK